MLADPLGLGLYSCYASGEFKAEGSSITEGIGRDRITANLEGFAPDRSPTRSPTRRRCRSFSTSCKTRGWPRRLDRDQRRRRHPAGARARPRPYHRDHPRDYGTRYQSKLFNPAFLKERNLPTPGWLREG